MRALNQKILSDFFKTLNRLNPFTNIMFNNQGINNLFV